MSSPASLETFTHELHRLVAKFEKEFPAVTDPGYSEARLRQDYLDPFIRALGWDLENHAGLIQREREVEIESRTDVAGRAKRADYLFRTDRRDRFVCEAKKPRVTLGPSQTFQVKRYAYNIPVPLAVLTDFEELKIYIVGDRPRMDDPDAGLWKSWHFKQYPLVAAEIWQLLAREIVAAGSIESEIEKLPKRAPSGRGKARQQWLIKPDRNRALDARFLAFLDEQRRALASDILRHNERADILAGTRLNEAVQSILDRLLFIRICEDRDIDTGTRLQSIVETWQRARDRDDGKKHRQDSLRLREEPPDMDGAGGGGSRSKLPRESLWRAVVQHLRALDRRPPSHVPFFNGNLFKQHFSEDLLLGDTWLAEFIGELSDEESPYLFSVIPVEILGSVYERFLGKVVRPHGRGVTIEEKPEVRKAGGVYYTPRYIVDYIVEQTVGRQLDGIARIPASAASTSEMGSAGFQPAASGILPDAGSGVPGKSRASSPSRAPTGLRQDAEASGLEACAPLSPGELRAPKFAQFDRATRALRLLDPACGSGSFLIRAFERVCEHWQRRFIRCPEDRRAELCWTDPATGDVHLTVAIKRRILRDNIYGVDLDAQAVEVTQLSLYLKMLEGEDRTTLQRQRELFKDEPALLPPLQDNIKCGNSLIASDFSLVPEDLVRVNAFDWETGFREIMQAGGFDAVIGNPPYGMIEDAALQEYCASNFRCTEGRYDIFEVFFEQAMKLARRDHGSATFIVPSPILTNVYSRKLRRLFISEGHLAEITNFGLAVFDDPTVHTCIIRFEHGKKPGLKTEVRYQVQDPQELYGGFDYSVPQSELPQGEHAAFDIFITPPLRTLCRKLESKSAPLGEVCYIRQCIKTGDDDTYVTSSPKPMASPWKPSLRGRSIERYDTREKDIYLKYGTWLARNWQNQSFYEVPKIAVRETGNRIIAQLDEDERYFLSSLYAVYPKDPERAPSLKYLLAVINSRLATWFVQLIAFGLTEGAFTKIRTNQFGRLPLRTIDMKNKPDRTSHDALVSLVDKMLALVPKLRVATSEKERAVLQNAVATTDRKIDELVYALYALTPEEIALVEGVK